MTEREKFEAWYGEHYTTYLPKDDGGEYQNLDTLLAWKTWMESRRAALEEAATVCDRMVSVSAVSYETGSACARDIRAIADGDAK